MSMTPDRLPGGELTHAQLVERGVTPENIDSEWLDEMVNRLFKELRKQLARIEATKPGDNDTKTASVRAANVRALGSIERTLERLARMEQQRVASRKIRTVATNDELRAELQRRIDNLLAYRGAAGVPGEAEEGST